MYVKDIEHGTTSVTSQPEVVKETPATAWVDGHHCLGAVVGNFSMDLAISKAKQVGVGWVAAKGNNRVEVHVHVHIAIKLYMYIHTSRFK